MENRRPKEGEYYKHFKGNIYQILAIAKHSETMEELVIYKDINGEQQVYARPLDMFVSKVDKLKYPLEKQVYRFEKLEEEPQEEASDKQALLLEFLDLDTPTQKIRFLQCRKNELTEDFLSMAAQCLEFAETKTNFEERYYDIMHYLRTVEKFEGGRM